MSKIYLEIFDEKRLAIFQFLSEFRERGYLAGGTALALQLKHRKSFDFDIFTQKQVDNKLRLKIKNIFGDVKVELDTDDQITFITNEGIRITFLWYYFHPLYPLFSTESLDLASVSDIAADKAYTLGRRATWRDYVDIYTLLKRNIVTIDAIISFAKKKFSGGFNEVLFLEQLVYFKDITLSPIEFIEEEHTPEEIKSFLEKQVNQCIKGKIV